MDWFLYDRDLRYERVNRCFDNCLFIGIFGKVGQIRKGKEEDTEKLTLYWIYDCVKRFLWKVYCDFDDSSFLFSEIHFATLLTRKVPIRNVFWLGMGLGVCSSVKCKSTEYLFFYYKCLNLFFLTFCFLRAMGSIRLLQTNCYLAASRPTLGHSQGDNLTNPILIITTFYLCRPEGHREPCNKVGFQSPAELLAVFEPGTFRF